MKDFQLIQRAAFLAGALALAGCRDSVDEGVSTDLDPFSDLADRSKVAEAARQSVEKEILWKKRTDSYGKEVTLFAAAPLPPDETRSYRVVEGGQPFFIRISRFGQNWQGVALDPSGQIPIRLFEGATAEECLQTIRTEYRFTGDFVLSIDCAWQ